MMTLPVPTGRPLVVFTDLDGTLIDHHNYGAGRSQEALRKLVKRGVPLIFCSSKTFAEQVYLQNQLGIIQPFIFENGSAVAIPPGFFSANRYTAMRREQGYDLVIFAHTGSAELQSALMFFHEIKRYATASDAELTAVTGLTGEALHRARERWFTETLLPPLDEASAAQLRDELTVMGFTLSRGGRFYTVQSDAVSKGKAVQWMMEIFCQESIQTPCFAAIGDSPNDGSMLEVVDAPFLVQRPDKTWADMQIPHLIKIKGVGPAGFSAVVQMLLGA